MIRNKLLSVFILIFLVIPSYPQQSPDEFFGFKIGADRTLVKYPDIITYFKYIGGASGRIKVTNEGQSTLGNDIYLAFISSKENIKRLPELIEINKKLASPDSLSREEADGLIKKVKVFVLITCALHATEIASTQAAMTIAHKLAVTENPELTKYLDDVVLMIMPSINPDGNIMVTDWYKKYVDTEFEGCSMPYLYHHYAGHDNNRDYYMLNLKESKVVNAVLHHRYFPIIFLDMHQMGISGPRMFVPPFKDPLNQNLNPLLVRETDIIGGFMALKLQEQGKKGVASSYGFDAYWPGGSKNTAWFKNVVGVLTEIASVNIASPIYLESNELRIRSKGLPEYKPQVNFPDPWPGGWWRLQDIIDYEKIAIKSLLEISSKNKESFLTSFYNLGIETVKRGKTVAPYGYVIPVEQWDQPAAYTFLQKMDEHGVRIYKLEETVQTGNTIYSKGSYVLPLAQPYGSFVKVMMEKQYYPEIKHMSGGPIIEPYDACGWTMPLQMGVKSYELNTSLETFKLSPVKVTAYPEEIVNGEGNYYCIPARFNRSVIVVNRLFKKGVGVLRFTGKLEKGSEVVAPGDFLVKTSVIGPEKMKALLTGTGVNIRRVNLGEPNAVMRIKGPRIGIYQPYQANMDEGWTRWVLDNFEFPYTVLHNKDFDNGSIIHRYDVILFADMSRDTIINGGSPMYRAYVYPNLPTEYKGGIGDKGLMNLKKYVQQGGSIVLMDHASELGIRDFALPLVNIMKGVKSEDFFCPGSILKLRIDNEDPVGWGLEKENFIFFKKSLAFKTQLPRLKSINRKVVAGFNETGNHLLSGYLKGGKKLDRAVTVVRFDYFGGNIIVFGGRVQHRAQTYGTFKFLFNSLYYSTLRNR